MEGIRVREIYKRLAQRHGVDWKARRYDQGDWDAADIPNRCLSAATACLYGLCEAAILAAGYAPAIGFLHRGKPQSFVYDIADLYKFETVVPAAFSTAARIAKGFGGSLAPERQVRIACREMFRKAGLLEHIIPDIEQILQAGGLTPPDEADDAPEAPAPAIPRPQASGDDGHRN